MRPILAAIYLLSAVLLATPTLAQVPTTMHVQGLLESSAGTPINGAFDVVARLYATQAAATPLWEEPFPAMDVQGGLVELVLGSGVPFPASFFKSNTSLWLSFAIDGEPELPRARLRSVPFALRARTAKTADQALALSCTGCVTEAQLGFDVATQAELDAVPVYVDANAVSAMGGKGAGNPLNHDRFTAAEAVAAMGAKGAGNALHHDRYGDADAVAAMGAKGAGNALHHDRYTDGDAIAALAPYTGSVDGKTGGSIDGNVSIAGTLAVTAGATIGGEAVCTAAGNCVSDDPLAALGCAEGQIAQKAAGGWECVDPQAALAPDAPCTGAGKALQWDGSAFTCVDVGSGGGSPANGFPLVDSWGSTWDGLERPARTWAEAKTICEAAGGRLPTTTELYRVSYGAGTGEVGTSYSNAWLWSIIERSASNITTLRLDTGAVSYHASSSTRAYRCIWPVGVKTWFAGNHCYGPPGSGCWVRKSEGSRYNMDRWDRPAVTYNTAVRECAFYRAHLPSELELTEEIRRGLPDGTNSWVWSSDGQGYYSDQFRAGTVRWTGVETSFKDYYSADATWAIKNGSTLRRFRCVGVRYDSGDHPNAIAGQWVGTSTRLKSTATDRPAKSWIAAVDTCWDGGGHLPTSRDLHELISEGLPNGTNQWLWTSDQHGHYSSTFRVGVSRWSGVNKSFTDYYSSDATWKNRDSGTNAFRCVYYPVDTAYTGPSSCNGGCYSSVRNGNVKVWTDKTDRPAAYYVDAVHACLTAKGHLASFRDMAELIRDGLPNGSNNWAWTSDQEGYNGTQFLVGIVRWAGTKTSWTGVYSTYSSWRYKSTNSYKQPYRCVWTNELR